MLQSYCAYNCDSEHSEEYMFSCLCSLTLRCLVKMQLKFKYIFSDAELWSICGAKGE